MNEPQSFLQVSKLNLSGQVYAQLRSALMDGRFVPGERLTIANLAAHFGTSITPVREAIFRLVSDQALEMRAATAIHVPTADPVRLREVQLIRLELEGAAAATAAERATEDDVRMLVNRHRRFMEAAAEDLAESSIMNRDFHFALVRMAGLPLVEKIVENCWLLSGPALRRFIELSPPARGAGRHPHEDVIAAVQRRDGAAAREAIGRDIRWGLSMVEKLAATVEPEPSFFQAREVRR
jgi:DNA-binding GntR family transcriptional regulator